MPRGVRTITPGAVYHLISRFVDRNWFITDGSQRALYLRLLGRAIGESDWECIAYAVMSNHIHLGVVAGTDPLETWIRRVNAGFADAMNRASGRIGSVFVRGPKDGEIAPERVPHLIAYIHNNPVRAGVAKFALDSGWTSHRAYLGYCNAPSWLNVEEGLSRAGLASGLALDEWTNASPSERLAIDLRPFQRAARRRGAILVGTPVIGDENVVPLVARPWGRVLIDLGEVLETVAADFGVSVDALRSRVRNEMVVRARRVVVDCSYRLGVTGADVAAALGVTQQAVSKMRHRKLPADDQAASDRTFERLTIGRVGGTSAA